MIFTINKSHDVIGFTVVGAYLALVAASNKHVQTVAKVSAKTVINSFMLAEKAYKNYLDKSDEETEELMNEIKRKVNYVKVKPKDKVIEKPGKYEFVL
ncbi:hypothetical protein MTP04_02960 [Lysinibacillus sp. PLM2]|nr:hypothetical protein MTP04_02960 [Lysinibacillus sp. PLM2]